MIVLIHTLLPASFAAAIKRFFVRLGSAMVGAVTFWRNRRELQDLADFDDRMLNDVGLTRIEVTRALEEPFFSDWARLVARPDESRLTAPKPHRPILPARRVQRAV